jgi:hypothetical protein
MNLGNRYQQQFDSRDDGGARKADVIAWGKAPQLKFFKPDLEGRNKFNILPYQIKSKNHPEVVAGRAKVGDWDYVMDMWIHRSIGPNKVDFLCTKKTYGKRCACCEEVERLYNDKRTDEAKSLKATRRVVYNVQPIEKGGPSDTVQVFNVSHYLFAKELMEEANSCANGKGVIPFADPDQGKIVSFRAAEEKTGTNTRTEFKSFQFLDRDEEISDEILDQCISFDEFLVVPTPAEVEAAMYGTDVDPVETGEHSADTEERETSRQSSRRSVPENDPEEDTGRSSRRPPREDPPEEVPEQTSSRGSGRKKDEDVIVDCPKGYTFGVDRDNKSGCSRCPDNVYEACQRAGKK